VRNDEEIKSAILLALFHFFCNIKSLNIAEYSQFFCLEKKEKLLRNMVDFISSTFLAKEKEIFCQSLR